MIYSVYKRLFASIFLAACLLSTQITFAQRKTTASHTIYWGIMGHPLTQESYLHQQPQFKNSIADQLDLVKSLGLTWYRVDVPTNADGNVENYYPFEVLKKTAAQKGIKLLPMLYLAGMDYNKSLDANYQIGYKVGSNFTRQHGQYFTHIELGNEQESDLLANGWQSPGSSANDYNQAKVKVVAAYLKGMIAGVKAAKPSIKTIVNTSGWVHFGFLELLKAQGVNFDIVGYHWYSDMGKLTDVRDYHYNIPDLLYQKFKKPVWITEISNRNGSNNAATEKDQATWIDTYITEAKKSPHVQAVFFYELYDQPVFNNAEANYGIVKWPSKYNNPTPKPAFNVIKNRIKGGK